MSLPANTHCLWPILTPAQALLNPPNLRPPFTLITVASRDTVISAHVIYETDTRQVLWIQGGAASTQREAYDKLLALTSKILYAKQEGIRAPLGTEPAGNDVDGWCWVRKGPGGGGGGCRGSLGGGERKGVLGG